MARNKYPEETISLIITESLKLFIVKGYDNTSIQDIINNLGGLSKGAIYHHFKSKEEIFEAVCNKIKADIGTYYDGILLDNSKNGYQKLKAIIDAAYSNPSNEAIIATMGKIMTDPKFLSIQVAEIYELVAPKYIQPIIEEGIKDGSIQTDYPKELAEVIITLLNLWINPVVANTTAEQTRSKLEFFALLLKGINIDIFDIQQIDRYVTLCKRYTNEK